jgi:tRNA(adenine34) deaminase
VEHEGYMREALVLAQQAYAIEEVPIGAVIVFEDQIIGRGYNMRNTNKSTLSHAELLAINEATRYLKDWRLEACTMYVTLEPCPMCAGAIVQSRMEQVVIGAKNYKSGSGGTITNLFNIKAFNHQVEVVHGVLEDECSQLLTQFFRELRQKRAENKV